MLSALLILGRNSTSANRILGVWCLIVSFYFAGPFITMNREINAFSSLIGWSYFLPSSFGAFLYLYCRNAVVEQKILKSDIWLFLPFIVCLLLNIDILIATPAVKLQIVLSGTPSTTSYVISQFIQGLQAFYFIGLSCLLINQYRSKAESTLSNFNSAIFNWLLKLIVLFFSIWLLKIVGNVVEGHSYLSIFADILIVFLIYSIAMAQWRNPKIFSIDQLSNESVTTSNEDDLNLTCSKVKLASKEVKQQKSNALDESIRQSLLETIAKHMDHEQTYLDNELTLASLSSAIGITTHHLSEVLNQEEGKNFYQYINGYRINYFCQKLAENHSLKLLDLAMDSGFSSKSTFNSVFKQLKGTTPSEYRKSLI
ncbi:MAG: AraC-like DNA-binding protein [Colwellia sp.]